MSILRQAARLRLEQDLILLYSNRRPEDAAFLTELQGLERGNERFRLIATMTQMNASRRPWAGRIGLIDVELLMEVSRVVDAPIYYIAGPTGMVETMRRTLTKVGIADDDIRSEEFHGY
jgi:ferredoxin-NADP reductase